jgi:hypothetical protein
MLEAKTVFHSAQKRMGEEKRKGVSFACNMAHLMTNPWIAYPDAGDGSVHTMIRPRIEYQPSQNSYGKMLNLGLLGSYNKYSKRGLFLNFLVRKPLIRGNLGAINLEKGVK